MLRNLSSLVVHVIRAVPSQESILLRSGITSQLGTLTNALKVTPLNEVRSFATPAAPASPEGSLTIDPSAVHRLQKLQEASPGSPMALRIEVEGGGCSGFHYKFELVNPDEKGTVDDIVFEREGAKVLCDASSFEFLRGSKIEFEQSLIKSAFVVSANPNAEMTCGCGTSFAFKMK